MTSNNAIMSIKLNRDVGKDEYAMRGFENVEG